MVSAVRLRRARLLLERALAGAEPAPRWLGYADLEFLSRSYGFPAPYGYDEESLARRGAERAAEILTLPGAASFRQTLEFGCGDGMVSASLAQMGRTAIAVDISPARFDKRAIDAGVDFRICDAADIGVPANTIDCVFSYNAFEHIADPYAVLAEMTRITRRGGLIYLSFGPLYWSAFGEHAYRSIPIPYCHCLFRLETMNQYCRDKGYDEIDPRHVNGWSLEQYRKLWEWSGKSLDRIRYSERSSAGHVDLIQRYASCFSSRSTSPLDFLIDEINIVFRKK